MSCPFFGMNPQAAANYSHAQIDAMAAELKRLGVGSRAHNSSLERRRGSRARYTA